MERKDIKMESKDSINVKDNVFVKPEKKWEKIYRFLLETGEPVPAYTLMHALNMTRTEFYNAIKWLRLMDLIVIELDENDMRKHLYRVKKPVKERM